MVVAVHGGDGPLCGSGGITVCIHAWSQSSAVVEDSQSSYHTSGRFSIQYTSFVSVTATIAITTCNLSINLQYIQLPLRPVEFSVQKT